MTYLALTRYAGTNNRAWPAYETLARDVSCGRKRVIGAVNKLVECKLVEKQVRGNRSNVYLVYPPEYFCEKDSENPQGVEKTPREIGRVSVEHPESIPETPQGCPQDTLRVSTGHPKSTNISNKENSTLTINNNDVEEREIFKKEIAEEDLEQIRKAFKVKGVKVTDKMIQDLLKSHDSDAVKAAIKCTDFNAARNPLAVIKWMLSTGTYVMPVDREIPVLSPEAPVLDPGEEETVRQMIKEAREGLKQKTMQTV